MRIYNPSLGKFLSVDPLSREFPWNSSYAFAENDVIRSTDLDGAEKNIEIQIFDPQKCGCKHIMKIVTIPYTLIFPDKKEGSQGGGTRIYTYNLKTKILEYKEYKEGVRVESTKSGKGTGSNADAVPKIKVYDPYEGDVPPNFSDDGGHPIFDGDINGSTEGGTTPEKKSGERFDKYGEKGSTAPKVGVAVKDGDTTDVVEIGSGYSTHNYKKGEGQKKLIRQIKSEKLEKIDPTK
ncbi:MAG: hypothetical protein K0R24_2459 [Gammaproteobacteria bacterium]|nr:hypothetical protein [Gammaproteobacteria bacterium]